MKCMHAGLTQFPDAEFECATDHLICGLYNFTQLLAAKIAHHNDIHMVLGSMRTVVDPSLSI